MRPGSKNSATQGRIPGRNYFVGGQGCWGCLTVGPRARAGLLGENQELGAGRRDLNRARTGVQFKFTTLSHREQGMCKLPPARFGAKMLAENAHALASEVLKRQIKVCVAILKVLSRWGRTVGCLSGAGSCGL